MAEVHNKEHRSGKADTLAYALDEPQDPKIVGIGIRAIDIYSEMNLLDSGTLLNERGDSSEFHSAGLSISASFETLSDTMVMNGLMDTIRLARPTSSSERKMR